MDNGKIQNRSEAVLEITGVTESNAGSYFGRVSNSVGNRSSNVAMVTVTPEARPAVITVEPQSVAIYEGGEATLRIESDGAAPITYQWFLNGFKLPGETLSTLTVSDATMADTGEYWVQAKNGDGSDMGVCTVTILKPSTGQPGMANMSNRGQVRSGNGVLIPGFVITGNEPKRLLIRGIGPALSGFNLSGVLEKPEMKLVSNGVEITRNSGWGNALNHSEIDAVGDLLGAFGLSADTNDCAMFVELQPGSYTVRLIGADNTTGLGLIEVYDADPGSDSRLVNMSVRAHVGTGKEILIPGLVVTGNERVKVLLRAVGPTLTRYGVGAALTDPKLTVVKNGQQITSNDNWGDNLNLGELITTSKTVGAFDLDQGSLDAAVIARLDAGAYTVKVEGVGGVTGICLVEVYWVE